MNCNPFKRALWLSLAFLLGLSGSGMLCAQNSVPFQLEDVGIDQRLNEKIPLELRFKDETGQMVQLDQFFGTKPVILTLVYYECPMLCNLVLNGMATALKPLDFTPGREFDILTISIDQRETPSLAAAKKQEYLQSYGRPTAETGWHFLTGERQEIRKLADAAGFRFKYDSEADQFAHAAAIMILTPEGRLARYLYGVEYAPRDLRLGLVEASQNRIGSPVDQVLLFCYRYDSLTGQYSLAIMKLVRAAGLLTVVGLGLLLYLMIRRENRGSSGEVKI